MSEMKDTQITEEFLYVLGHERSLRKRLKNVDINTLAGYRSRLDKIIAEREKEEEQARAEAEEKLNNVKTVLKFMEENGLSKEDIENVEDLEAAIGPKKTPKYLLIIDGKKHRWSGRGRIPKVFEEAIERGINIDYECLAREIEPEAFVE